MKNQILLLALIMFLNINMFSQGFGRDSVMFRDGSDINTFNVYLDQGYLISWYPIVLAEATGSTIIKQESAGPAWFATSSDMIYLGREAPATNDKIMSTVYAGIYTAGHFNDTGYVSKFRVDSNGVLESELIVAPLILAPEMAAQKFSVGYMNTTDTVVNFRVDSLGNVYARRIKVTQSDFPDYVFDEGYQLMSLGETEAYIRKNGHLPGVPSAKEVEEEGLNLGEMNAILLKKIEEMTLLMIEQQKQIEQLKQEMETREKTR